jgi:hypothetical protein
VTAKVAADAGGRRRPHDHPQGRTGPSALAVSALPRTLQLPVEFAIWAVEGVRDRGLDLGR